MVTHFSRYTFALDCLTTIIKDMEKLIKILEKFDTLRDYYKEHNLVWDESSVAECFKSCAKEILCGGYFLVNNEYIIDLGAIELYYNEEGDGKERIKDPIMYHTNDKNPYSIHYKKIGKYPYFKFGSFNLHQSGVDVTFENPDKEYRASFLIRSYRVIGKGENEPLENIKSKLNNLSEPKFDPHSTHIFDDMFPNGIIFGNNKGVKVEWIPCVKEGEIEVCKRINVDEYKKDNQGVYINVDKKYEKLEPIQHEHRNWGFKRIGIKEDK